MESAQYFACVDLLDTQQVMPLNVVRVCCCCALQADTLESTERSASTDSSSSAAVAAVPLALYGVASDAAAAVNKTLSHFFAQPELTETTTTTSSDGAADTAVANSVTTPTAATSAATAPEQQHRRYPSGSSSTSSTSSSSSGRSSLLSRARGLSWSEQHGGPPPAPPSTASSDADGTASPQMIPLTGHKHAVPALQQQQQQQHEGASRHQVFGVELGELCRNPRRSPLSLLDPAAQLPDAVNGLFDALCHPLVLSEHGMFRTAVPHSDLAAVMRSMDADNAVPAPTAVNPHALTAALLVFLHKLPVPLLTWDRYDAFVACCSASVMTAIDSKANDVTADSSSDNTSAAVESATTTNVTRNLKLLVEEHYTAVNGLDLATLSHLLAPALLRPYQSQPSSSSISSNSSSSGVTTHQPHGDGIADEAGEATAAVVACILQHHKLNQEFVQRITHCAMYHILIFKSVRALYLSEVLPGVRQELKLRKARITAKTVRILQLQRMLSAKVYLKREGTLALAQSLWVRLEPCECAIASAKATEETGSTNDNIIVTSGSSTAATDSEQRRHSRSSSTGSTAEYDAAMYERRVSFAHERKSSTAVLVQAHSFLASQRWVVCCMSSSAAAVCDDLRAARSIFALDCVNYFLLAYPVTSAHILTATAALRCHSTSSSSVISSGIQHEGSWLVRAGMIAAAVAEALELPHQDYSNSSSS
eukprot:6467-Heterococcus_DN1.PRE.1